MERSYEVIGSILSITNKMNRHCDVERFLKPRHQIDRVTSAAEHTSYTWNNNNTSLDQLYDVTKMVERKAPVVAFVCGQGSLVLSEGPEQLLTNSVT